MLTKFYGSYRSLPLSDDSGRTSEMFSIAAVLPEQFYSSAGHAAKEQPEVILMRAVLEDAVMCFQKQFVSRGRRVQRLAQEAEEWVFTDDHHWPFSFVHICTVLGLDPEYIRRGLKRWYQHRPLVFKKKKRRVVPARRPLKIAA